LAGEVQSWNVKHLLASNSNIEVAGGSDLDFVITKVDGLVGEAVTDADFVGTWVRSISRAV
jgi:hypothetical protein